MGETKSRGITTEDITHAAAAIALLAVSAWVTIPLGPVPFTLQTMALALVALALPGRQVVLALVGYVLVGAVGGPVFSGMRGGIGVLMGPTGGFIWGFILAAVLMWLLGRVRAPKGVTGDVVRLAIVLLSTYACGVAWLMLSAHMGLMAALLAGVIPFVIPDVLKLVAGMALAKAVRRALPSLAS